jgi:precorrin-6Y C5,15-methyltransferase (decarboxylating)
VRLLGSDGVEIVPSVSSVSLACARLGWPVDEVAVVSSVGRPRELLHPAIQPGRRVLVLTTGRDAADGIARMLCERGFGPSRVTVLERLGAPDERRCAATARDWRSVDGHDPLAVVAVDCVPGRGADVLPTVPGLPDSAYRGDGQLTKREVRAVTLAALGPLPGQTLWDVGAGTGTIGIEWMRSQPGCHAVAVEPRPDRASTIAANAAALGVPGIDVVVGAAPAALAGLPRPDAVFVGGGVSTAGVVDACLAALGAGGRLVANAVTVEAEVALAGWRARLGGDLVRVSVSRAAGLGSFTAWRPAMPVTQWSYSRERTG